MAFEGDIGELRVRATQPLEPALWPFQPGRERHRVAGAGASAILLSAGDRVTLIDVEGAQPAEVVAVAEDGRDDLPALGLSGSQAALGLQSALSFGDDSATHLASALKARNVEVGSARCATLFGPDSRAGDSTELRAERDLLMVVAAPGEPMAVDQQNPPSELTVLVERAQPLPRADALLPDPLAEPRLDFRVPRATALAYEVKAGEYVQIIDVEGRECSDFQAFHRGQLDKGVERDIDPTITRTLMGAAYPGPGLFSKFYDRDMNPNLELVRDTCGRHDAFLLACTARYYDDMGYPGHPNCSDNFNNALQPHGVEPRMGWAALNLFFNTGVDAHNQVTFDMPWSRPGDYVLMRANTDLLCVSSACPDDLSAANGWDPTEIHVRVYPAENLFSKAIATRMTPDAEPKLTRETAFHPRTAALTRNFTEYRGYWLANAFNNHGAIEEYWACREKAVVTDLSALRKFEVTGPDSEALMHATLTRNVRRMSHGQVAYSAMCYPHGGMLDDGTLFRLGPDNFRWIGGDDYGGVWLREQADRLGLKVLIKSSTDQIHNIAVQGPESRAILSEVVWTPPAQPSIEEMGWFRFSVGRLGDHNGPPLVVSRTGYTGELGYEVWCHPKDATAVWDAVFEAGQPRGLTPLGLEALDMLRIEAGLIFYGYEFTDQTDPFEAGIGFSVALKTKAEDDFIGKEALIERKAHPQKVLVGLELEGNEPASHGDCVHVGRPQVGEITSATRSPILNKNIALCRMDVAHSELGTEVEVGKLDGNQKRLAAKVVPFPFYDPEKTRVRS